MVAYHLGELTASANLLEAKKTTGGQGLTSYEIFTTYRGL